MNEFNLRSNLMMEADDYHEFDHLLGRTRLLDLVLDLFKTQVVEERVMAFYG